MKKFLIALSVFIILIAAVILIYGAWLNETIISKDNSLIICRKPDSIIFRKGNLDSITKYNGNPRAFERDLRMYDPSGLDLRNNLTELLHSDFDSKTNWPKALPEGFNPDSIMEIGKNPGLGIRKLHENGITGKGIGIAIIDQALLVDHIEYKDQLRMYEEIHGTKNQGASMHGPAVASIAVGRTVGVAPNADLFYIYIQAWERYFLKSGD